MTEFRSLSEIAIEIKADWTNIYFGAEPYLQALAILKTMNDKYGLDDAQSIVAYFLSNAHTWRGEVARRIKKELNKMLRS